MGDIYTNHRGLTINDCELIKIESIPNIYQRKGKGFFDKDNVFFIYRDVIISGSVKLMNEMSITKPKKFDGVIWGFYPCGQSDFYYNNLDRYRELKRDYLNLYYEDTERPFLSCNALGYTLTHLIDEVLDCKTYPIEKHYKQKYK